MMRKFFIGITITSLIVVVLYSFYIEPQKVNLKTVKIRNKALASTFKKLKIVQLSDLHIGENRSLSIKHTLTILNTLKPDLILLTGDYVKWNAGKQAYDNAISFLSKLSAPLGVYAVMGDADYSFSRWSCLFCHSEGSTLPPIQHQVKFLRNARMDLEAGGTQFSIIGLGNSDYAPDLKTLHKMHNGKPTIVLSHVSSVYNSINATEDVLVLSGDTHGGQVFLPEFIWKIIKRKPDVAHIYGLYRNENKSLYVTSGIGTSDLRFRFGMPPEVVLFEFIE
ncbi:phosphohydrolase [Candidatus Scalindua japonica]|uniref:Phosphohydrolase n=1 Tax=Candidatus Scalindua japonica TaxID=1284222 RepID=A0A286U4D0_9BACT|nr:metallophosphoesterase [Candidatus Scalindua japonica]GAX63000.1 phosphohydrolase [Candidatus Scalindua japonica]